MTTSSQRTQDMKIQGPEQEFFYQQIASWADRHSGLDDRIVTIPYDPIKYPFQDLNRPLWPAHQEPNEQQMRDMLNWSLGEAAERLIDANCQIADQIRTATRAGHNILVILMHESLFDEPEELFAMTLARADSGEEDLAEITRKNTALLNVPMNLEAARVTPGSNNGSINMPVREIIAMAGHSIATIAKTRQAGNYDLPPETATQVIKNGSKAMTETMRNGGGNVFFVAPTATSLLKHKNRKGEIENYELPGVWSATAGFFNPRRFQRVVRVIILDNPNQVGDKLINVSEVEPLTGAGRSSHTNFDNATAQMLKMSKSAEGLTGIPCRFGGIF